jgi:hypothetical protein
MPTLRNREKTAPPSSPIRRRITRATSHISETEAATTSVSTPETLGETAPSSSVDSSPERTIKLEDEDSSNEMLHREGASRRSKNIEDVNDIEEKGLYRTYSNDTGARGDDVREKLLAERERSPSVEREGLNSKRDKEAFALLVVLCKLNKVVTDD